MSVSRCTSGIYQTLEGGGHFTWAWQTNIPKKQRLSRLCVESARGQIIESIAARMWAMAHYLCRFCCCFESTRLSSPDVSYSVTEVEEGVDTRKHISHFHRIIAQARSETGRTRSNARAIPGHGKGKFQAIFRGISVSDRSGEMVPKARVSTDMRFVADGARRKRTSL